MPPRNRRLSRCLILRRTVGSHTTKAAARARGVTASSISLDSLFNLRSAPPCRLLPCAIQLATVASHDDVLASGWTITGGMLTYGIRFGTSQAFCCTTSSDHDRHHPFSSTANRRQSRREVGRHRRGVAQATVGRLSLLCATPLAMAYIVLISTTDEPRRRPGERSVSTDRALMHSIQLNQSS